MSGTTEKPKKNIVQIAVTGPKSPILNKMIIDFFEGIGLTTDREKDIYYIATHKIMRFYFEIPKSKQIEFRDKT